MSARVHADCDIASALAARAMRARLRDGFEHDRGALGFTRRPGADGNRRGGGFRGFGGDSSVPTGALRTEAGDVLLAESGESLLRE